MCTYTHSRDEPIIGATVLVKGTGIGTATDIDGKFSLDIPSNGKTLVVSFIGFDAQEIPVTNNATYKIQLSGTDYALDEVVVTVDKIVHSSDIFLHYQGNTPTDTRLK